MGINRKPLRLKTQILLIAGIFSFLIFQNLFWKHITNFAYLGQTISTTAKLSRGAPSVSVAELLNQSEFVNINPPDENPHRAPLKNIILTSWRSGSTFLGETVASHPGTFYHFEPLMHFRIVQVRAKGPLADEGTRVLKNLMNCDYSNLHEYVEFGKEHLYLHRNNPRLWEHCESNRSLCENGDFLSKLCNNFPIQLFKVVRFRLQVAESLLNDPSLDVRILLLVRDPRGVLQSRKSLKVWCSEKQPDCHEPSLVCQDMIDDYRAAKILRGKYPNKLMLVRYEDLSLNLEPGVKKILNFFRLSYHTEIQKFLKNHTSEKLEDVYGTHRDTRAMPFAWVDRYLEQNASNEIRNIEQNENCETALRLWGYANLDLMAMQNNYKQDQITSPLLQPPWPDMLISS